MKLEGINSFIYCLYEQQYRNGAAPMLISDGIFVRTLMAGNS